MRKVATIGSFDGVHRGHRCLLEQVRGIADRQGLKAMAVTFALPPKSVLGGSDMVQLNSMEERIALLNQAGMDEVAVLNFTHEMAAMTARDFMQQVLKEQLDVAVLVIGYDHRFGRGRTDGFDDYVRYGRELDIEVVRGEACIEDGEAVSSTRIRRCIAEGDVTGAAHLLGYNYRLCGTVVGGYRVGRKIGFPTANIERGEPMQLLPLNGVYEVSAIIGGKRYRGAMNVGVKPTVTGSGKRTVEMFIIDFEGDIYGCSIEVEFVRRLREERRFASLDELKAQIVKDVAAVRMAAQNR